MKRLESRNLFVLPYLLVFGAALLRLTVSHPYNFVPVFACLLFFGANRPKREFAIPLLALDRRGYFPYHASLRLPAHRRSCRYLDVVSGGDVPWRHNAAQLAIDSTRAWSFAADLDFVLSWPATSRCGLCGACMQRHWAASEPAISPRCPSSATACSQRPHSAC